MYLYKCFLQGSSTVAGARSRLVVPANFLAVVAYLRRSKQMKALHIKVIASKKGLLFPLLLKTAVS